MQVATAKKSDIINSALRIGVSIKKNSTREHKAHVTEVIKSEKI